MPIRNPLELNTCTPFGNGSHLAEEYAVRQRAFHKVASRATGHAVGQTVLPFVAVNPIDAHKLGFGVHTSIVLKDAFSAIGTGHLYQSQVLFQVQFLFNVPFLGLCFEDAPFVFVIFGTVAVSCSLG